MTVKAGTNPVDVYGTAWGSVLADADPQALVVGESPTIDIPDGIPDVE